MSDRLTVPGVMARKGGAKLVSVTAYDAPTARLLDAAGVDIILVGDSVATTVLGYESTLPVTMEEMLHHVKAVRRGMERALLVADMPFLSYQPGPEDAIRNAGLFIKAGADAVKLEGGVEVAETVRRLTVAGIPVMGHVGLTPQKVLQFGGYRAQGKDAPGAYAVWQGAIAVGRAGAFSVVLESVPAALGRLVTRDCPVPVIGIGAGPDCDGQVLVFHDLVGLTPNPPKFARAYANGLAAFRGAVEAYSRDVRAGGFPAAAGGPEIPPAELADLERMIDSIRGK
jgi:3-methyl-2-oxobutanoate hydroxymethyltransferase